MLKRSIRGIVVIIFVVVFFIHYPLTSSADEDEKDYWSTPEEIDPLKEGIGDFLDTNLSEYEFKANNAYKMEKYELAAKYYLYILRHRYDSVIHIYNLACCYAKMDEPRLAAKYLARAFAAGYRDIDHFKKDHDFDMVRGSAEFRNLEEKLISINDFFGSEILFKAEKIIPGRIHLPEDYNKEKTYPLLICLHGRGDSAIDFSAIWDKIEDKEFILVVPEAPYELHNIHLKRPGYSWFYLSRDRDLWMLADPLTVEYVTNVYKEIKSKYKVSSTYLLGFSQGVAVAYMTAFSNPDVFKGVIAFAGVFPEEQILPVGKIKDAAGKIDIFISHGERDKAISYKKSISATERLRKLGFNVKYHAFKEGHRINREALNKAIDWILFDKDID